jgi:DNA-directed RNA polymerase subunit RPC12/RpoP
MSEEQEQELVTLRCMRCDHEWVPRKPDPTMCPNCKSKLWDVPKKRAKRKDMGMAEKDGGNGQRPGDKGAESSNGRETAMTSNYRIVRYIVHGIVEEGSGERYAVHEAYYAQNEIEPHYITENPVAPSGGTIEELQNVYAHMGEAFTKMALEWESFGPPPTVYGRRVRMRVANPLVKTAQDPGV